MYSKTITVLGAIPPETSERSEPPEQYSDFSLTTSDEDDSSDFKEEKSPRAAYASFGSPPVDTRSASSALHDASETSKALRDAAVFGASPVAKIGGEHQTMAADAAVTPSDFASLPEPDARSIPVARDEAKKFVVVAAASGIDSVEVDAKSASSQLQDASGASKAVDYARLTIPLHNIETTANAVELHHAIATRTVCTCGRREMDLRDVFFPSLVCIYFLYSILGQWNKDVATLQNDTDWFEKVQSGPVCS